MNKPCGYSAAVIEWNYPHRNCICTNTIFFKFDLFSRDDFFFFLVNPAKTIHHSCVIGPVKEESVERGDDDLEPVSPERNSLPPDDAFSDQEQEEDEGAGEDEDDDARSEGSEPEEEEEEMEDEEEGEEEMEDDGEGRGGAAQCVPLRRVCGCVSPSMLTH